MKSLFTIEIYHKITLGMVKLKVIYSLPYLCSSSLSFSCQNYFVTLARWDMSSEGKIGCLTNEFPWQKVTSRFRFEGHRMDCHQRECERACVCVCVRVRVKERERELRRSDHQRSGGESSPIGTQLLISLKISRVSNHVENLHLSLNNKVALVTKYHYEISNVTLNFEK